MHLNPVERQPGIIKQMEVPEGFRLGGWVYVLSNPSMPRMYKVGMTTNSPKARAKEISSATGVPTPFVVEASFFCDNPARSEAAIHNSLSDWRVNQSREFFSLDLEEILYCCEEHCQGRADMSVEAMAFEYDILCFETLSELNVAALFDDLGINTFGNKLAIAERLIRFGYEVTYNRLIQNNLSLVLVDDKAIPIMSLEQQQCEEEERQVAEYYQKRIAAGIYGPSLPVDF